MRRTYLVILCGWFAEDRKRPIKHEGQCFIGTSRQRDKSLMWRSTEYFWRNLTCLDSRWNSVSSVWYIFLVETIKNYGEKWSSKSVKIYASKTRCPFPEGPEQFSPGKPHSKITSLVITELFYSRIPNTIKGSFDTRSFKCVHLSVFRCKWTKMAFRARKVPGVFEKRAAGGQTSFTVTSFFFFTWSIINEFE